MFYWTSIGWVSSHRLQFFFGSLESLFAAFNLFSFLRILYQSCAVSVHCPFLTTSTRLFLNSTALLPSRFSTHTHRSCNIGCWHIWTIPPHIGIACPYFFILFLVSFSGVFFFFSYFLWRAKNQPRVYLFWLFIFMYSLYVRITI